jgi:serine kinase of HPr protein (carbohydrate metabolism regulator)
MTVRDIADRLGLKVAAGEKGLDREVKGAYVCDLLSWVMAHAGAGNAWITIQTHSNIIAVAVLLEISCIIIPENSVIEDETLKKAGEEGIPVLVSDSSAYNICTSLYSITRET